MQAGPLRKDFDMFADLLPCPFCGGKAIHNTNPIGDIKYDYWVSCETCNASSYIFEGVNGSVGAYQAWNRRTNIKEAGQPVHNSQSDAIIAQIRKVIDLLLGHKDQLSRMSTEKVLNDLLGIIER